MLAVVAARPEAATRASARDEEAVRDARWRASVYRGNTDVPGAPSKYSAASCKS